MGALDHHRYFYFPKQEKCEFSFETRHCHFDPHKLLYNRIRDSNAMHFFREDRSCLIPFCKNLLFSVRCMNIDENDTFARISCAFLSNSNGMDASDFKSTMVQVIGAFRQKTIVWAIIDPHICHFIASIEGNESTLLHIMGIKLDLKHTAIISGRGIQVTVTLNEVAFEQFDILSLNSTIWLHIVHSRRRGLTTLK